MGLAHWDEGYNGKPPNPDMDAIDSLSAGDFGIKF